MYLYYPIITITHLLSYWDRFQAREARDDESRGFGVQTDTKKHTHVQSRDWPMWKMESPSPERMQPWGPVFVEQKERLNSDPACDLHWVPSVSLTAQPLCPGTVPRRMKWGIGVGLLLVNRDGPTGESLKMWSLPHRCGYSSGSERFFYPWHKIKQKKQFPYFLPTLSPWLAEICMQMKCSLDSWHR